MRACSISVDSTSRRLLTASAASITTKHQNAGDHELGAQERPGLTFTMS